MINSIAIIGATGMLGQPVAKAFLSAGYTVRVISRNAAKATQLFDDLELLSGKNLQVYEADIFNKLELRQALAGVESIHINLSGNSPASYKQNHVVGTQNILDCLDEETTKLITMISTASAYAQNSFRADTKAKLDAEKLLQESKFPYISFMPSWFYETLHLLVENDTVTTMCTSTQPLSWLSANDFAQSVVQSYSNVNLYNRRLTMIGPEKMSITHAANKYAETKRLKRLHLDNEQAWAYAHEIQDNTLLDAVDLLEYTEKVGEVIDPKTLSHPLRHPTTFTQWLNSEAK